MPRILTFAVRDPGTIRDSMLRVLRNGYIARGVESPNVTPGSDDYVRCQAVANEIAVVEANSLLASDDVMPDAAEGEQLLRQTRIHGFSLQPAAGSAGFVILSSSADTTIPTGTQLMDGAGLLFEVPIGGTYQNGKPVPVRALAKGEATNHDAGDVLRWVDHVPFADEKAVVGAGGLTDGHDDEDIEGHRLRFLDYLRNPPRSGNWEHVAELAEKSSPAVKKAFVYPAPQGGATMHVAVVAEPTATNKSRDVDATTLNTTIRPTIIGKNYEHSYIVVTTVANVDVEIAILLKLPEAITASPPGPGGGWLDATPWPTATAPSAGTRVTVATSSLQMTVDALTPPTAGVTRVSWVRSADWTVRTARVVSYSGTSGAYVINLDEPFDGVAVGDMIWPACENGQAYLDTLLDHMARMGPGEKSTNVFVLQRGFRRPRPEASWPYGLDSELTSAITHGNAEVRSSLFLFRSDGTTDLYTVDGTLDPATPGTIESPPKIFRPSKLGFYRMA